MKKLIITNLYKPYARGGAERVVEQQVDSEIKQGNEVVVFTARPWTASSLFPRCDHPRKVPLPFREGAGEGNGNPTQPPLEKGRRSTTDAQPLRPTPYTPHPRIYHVFPLNIFYYPNDHKKHPVVRALWHIIDTLSLHTFLATVHVIHKEKPDVVHTHNLKGIGFLIPLAIKLTGRAHIHTLHDLQLITPSGLMMIGEEDHWQHTGIITRVYRFITRTLFGSPVEIISPSQWLADEHTKHGFFKKSKHKVICNTPHPIFAQQAQRHSERSGVKRNAVEESRGEAHEASSAVPLPIREGAGEGNNNPTRPPLEKGRRSSVDTLQKPTIYIYAGQLEPHKGIIKLLEEFKTKQNAYLHLFGDGSLLQLAKETSQKHPHIKTHGPVTREVLAHNLAHGDIFVYPSLVYENCPMAILEAQAVGLEIDAPQCGGIIELLES